MDVVIWEAAHVFRAGAFGEGINTHTIKSTHRLYMSTRLLSGAAPGSLLKSWQDLSKAEPRGSTPWERFGPAVYRLSHMDVEELQITVPLRLSFIEETTGADEVAQELARLHRELNISTFKIVPPRDGLAIAVNKVLQNLTEAKCAISTNREGAEAEGLDAVILAEGGSSYSALAHDFFRLARRSPGKRAGFIFLGSGAAELAVAAWRALAIERPDVERAIQTATVETGRQNHRLRWEEIPSDLRGFIRADSSEDLAESAVARAVKELGLEWDADFGRLRASQDRRGRWISYSHVQYGYPVGEWLLEQKKRAELGLLDQEKIARLRGTGVLMTIGQLGEKFDVGLDALRKYVEQNGPGEVSLNARGEDGFKLGEWVRSVRHLQHRGGYDQGKRYLTANQSAQLRSAFQGWRSSSVPKGTLAEHPDDKDARELTLRIEEELKSLKTKGIKERKKIFRAYVMEHHPDVSHEKHADKAIKYLSDVKDWFISG